MNDRSYVYNCWVKYLSYSLLALSIGFIFGVGIGSIPLGFEFEIVALILLVVLSITLTWYNRERALFVLLVVTGAIYGFFSISSAMENMQIVHERNTTEIVMDQELKKHPQETEKGIHLTLPTTVCNYDHCVDTHVRVSTDKYQFFAIGDILHINCQAQKPENFTDDFDWRMYLAKDNTLLSCRQEEIQIVGHNTSIRSMIANGRLLMESNINEKIGQPYAALANGLLFGGAGRMSNELKELFQKTGMTHIVAVSGFNVTIISLYCVVLSVWAGLWRKQALWVALCAIALFVVAIGSPPSGVRAGIMGGFVLLSMMNGRMASSKRALVIVAALMLLYNPMLLAFDVGFQLSFLATLGIIVFFPMIERYTKSRYHLLTIIWTTLATTICAQLLVIPILLYHFDTLPTLSIIPNLLVLPILPLTMLFVFLSALFAFFLEPVSILFGWIAHTFLLYEVWIIKISSQIPGISHTVTNTPSILYVLYYLLLAAIVYKKQSKPIFLAP